MSALKLDAKPPTNEIDRQYGHNSAKARRKPTSPMDARTEEP